MASFRLATVEDAEPIRDIYAPYCATPISFELSPPSVEDMRQRIAKIGTHYPWLVCEQDGEIQGYVYAGLHRERAAYRWSVDVSAYVHPQRQRLGIGRALYTSLFRLLVLQGFVNAYAGVTLPNPASVGLHTALGFQPVGVYKHVGFKYDVWHDVGWYQLLLQPRPTQPPQPKTLAEAAQPEWQTALNAGLPLMRLTY